MAGLPGLPLAPSQHLVSSPSLVHPGPARTRPSPSTTPTPSVAPSPAPSTFAQQGYHHGIAGWRLADRYPDATALAVDGHRDGHYPDAPDSTP
jgi:hypothetical protein